MRFCVCSWVSRATWLILVLGRSCNRQVEGTKLGKLLSDLTVHLSAPSSLLSTLESLLARLSALLIGPKGPGRQKLVNLNALGSEHVKPVKEDREFTKVVEEVGEVLKRVLRWVLALALCFRDRRG